MEIKTFVEQMKDDLIKLGKTANDLIKLSSIRKFRNDPYSRVLIVAPPYYWGELSSEGETVQTNASEMLADLTDRLDMLFNGKPSTIIEKYEGLKNYFISLINREGNDWSVPESINLAEIELQENIEEMSLLLDWLTTLGNKEIIIVPDTNALIMNNRIELYGQSISGADQWTVIVTSTVLRELDELKIKNIGNEFREKVKKTISYIKGFRNQGDVITGVKIFNNKVTFKLSAIEPDMNKTLSWLDADNNDDRIIATCFDIQTKNPASSVILMTADINLQTKAQMAKLPFVDPEI